MSRRRAGRGHGGQDVRLAEGSEPLLASGVSVGPDGATERTLREQDKSGTEGLRVEDVPEGDSGEVSAISNEAGVRLVEHSLHVGSTVLARKRNKYHSSDGKILRWRPSTG